MKPAPRHLFFLMAALVAAEISPAQTILNPPPRRLQPNPARRSPLPPTAATLVFDHDVQQYNASPGEAIAPFTLKLVNIASNELVINNVHASCGCTTARLPPLPWHIPPGGHGEVKAEIKLAGKMGLVIKTLTFFTSAGTRVVTLKVNIPPPRAVAADLSSSERQAAMAKAADDPQAIFHGDCASCHVEKGRRTIGQELYAADCGICHESPHRASAVPDLHALKQPTNFDYWKTIITAGKPHTMMPAFAQELGGPLNKDQILSLAAYLDRTISHHF